MRRLLFAWPLALTTLAACGNCGESPGQQRPDPVSGDAAEQTDAPVDGGESMDPADSAATDDSSDDPGDGSSAPPNDSSAADVTDADRDAPSDTTDRCSADRTYCDQTCVDTETNGEHCGDCGQFCSGRQTCTEGDCTCPRYHQQCDGTCEALHVDPDNCGACGNECTGDEVCSAGTCSTQCLPGRAKCGNACVDRATDDDHCGECGNTCPTGEGCVRGNCRPKVNLGNPPAKCDGGGPQIDIDFEANTDRRCLGNVAQRSFRWAICSCDDLQFGNKLKADAYDSTLGRYEPGGLGGSLGTNGQFNATDQTHVWGGTWTSSNRGIRFENKTTVELELHSGGDAHFENDTTVAGNAYVEDDVTGQGPVDFDSTLHTPRTSQISSGANYSNYVETSVDIPTVCKRCESPSRVPVDGIVADHSGTNNDNQAVGLDPAALQQPGDPTRLELPCGEYYLDGIDTDEKLTIVATGRTALYIDGDVRAKNKVSIQPAPDAEFDVFIAGDAEFENDVAIGSPAYPTSMRFWVGGDRGWIADNKLDAGAYIYALPGGVTVKNKAEIFGGLYTQKLDAGNDVFVHYDRAILDAGKTCNEPEPPSPPDGSLDAGFSDADGSSDTPDTHSGGGDDGQMDGGTSDPPTSACRERDEPCARDDDCCSPMICDSEDRCGTTSCNHLYEPCSDDADCCSGSCSGSGSDAVCTGN